MTTDLAVWTSSTVGDDPLLASKFAIPEPPRFMVPRPRLIEQLSPAPAEPVTVVTGPAGSGKTQLVAAWVRGNRVADHVVWITLEDDDGAACMFWTYVVEGLRRAGVSLPSLAVPLPTASVNRSFLIRLAADLSEQPDSVVLVLDGVSSLSHPQWATDLGFLARHAGQRLRLVLVGRWDPPVPLHRYRLSGRLTEVRSGDLAFTREETAALLTMHGITLSESALTSLQEHTEGWAAGLRLFALALEGRGDADEAVDTISGDEANIAEYFAGEVLRAQPPDVRSFLLQTSVLDDFTPELAQALTGRVDAHRLLLELERGNAFVSPTDERAMAHRYHRLFAELLRAQLAYEEPDMVPRLHRRAARWLAEHGQVVEAVTHAVKVGDWGIATASVVGNYALGALLLGGRTGRLGALFRDLPDDVDLPEAAMVTAALAVADGHPDRCADHLARAEDLVVNRGYGYSDALALADTVVEMLLAVARHDSERARYSASVAESLLAQAPEDRLSRSAELRVLMLEATGTAQSWTGALDDAVATLTQAAAEARTDCEYAKITCLQHLALIEAYRGRLNHAERLANEAIDLAERCGLEPERRPVGAQVALAWVAVERYDVESAGRHLRVAEPKDGIVTDGLVAAAYALVKSRRLQARGELRGAMKALHDAKRAGAHPAWLAQEITLGLARLLTMTGHPDQSLALIRQLPEAAGADVAVVLATALLASGEPDQAAQVVTPITKANGVRSPVAVDAWLVLASLAAHTGDRGRARDALRQALRLAAPECQRRAVQQVWAQLRRILRDDEELAGQYRALTESAGRAGRPKPSAAVDTQDLVIVDPLSKREMEVLRGMATLLPTEEIAASMYVSVNTVKTHVRSILRKLSASRRNEAVRRARALGLI